MKKMEVKETKPYIELIVDGRHWCYVTTKDHADEITEGFNRDQKAEEIAKNRTDAIDAAEQIFALYDEPKPRTVGDLETGQKFKYGSEIYRKLQDGSSLLKSSYDDACFAVHIEGWFVSTFPKDTPCELVEKVQPNKAKFPEPTGEDDGTKELMTECIQANVDCITLQDERDEALRLVKDLLWRNGVQKAEIEMLKKGAPDA